MSKSAGGLLWSVADILTGRRRHWNSVCVPTLQCLMKESDSIDWPLQRAIRLLLAASWTAFRSDFSQGIFRRWQKSLDRKATRELLATYLAHLVQVCSVRNLWHKPGLSENQLWNAARALLPEMRNLEKELIGLEGQELTRKLSRLHLALLSVVTGEELVNLSSSEQFFGLRYYHPRLLIDLSQGIASELSCGL